MSVVAEEFVISQGSIAFVAEELGLTLPATVAREPLYYEDGERQRVREAVYGELSAIGLANRSDPSDALIDSLRVMCAATVEFYGFISAGQRTYNLHVAARDQDGVFAALAGEEVVLRPAHTESLVSELLAELPECRPAGGRSMSAPEPAIQPPSPRAQATGAMSGGDARRLRELLTQPHSAAGKLHTATRTGVDGRRVYSTDPVAFVDVDEGRWLTYATDDGNGTRYVTAAPGRADAIASTLEQARRALHSPHH